MRVASRVCALIAVLLLASSPRLALAQPAPPPDPQRPAYTPGELVNAGHRFFGGVSSGLATLIEKAVSQWGLPNGYVLGEEAGGAFSAVCVTAKACSTPRMPAISGCSGRARRSDGISAVRVRGP